MDFNPTALVVTDAVGDSLQCVSRSWSSSDPSQAEVAVVSLKGFLKRGQQLSRHLQGEITETT